VRRQPKKQKTEGREVNTYETTLILSPLLPEADWETKVSKYEGIIAANQGEVSKKEIWGIRKMAYAIKGRDQGYYVHFQYQSPGALPRELERNILLDEDILRYLTVLSEKPAPPKPEALPAKGGENAPPV
jgi:small subunit ribosomal protein S6